MPSNMYDQEDHVFVPLEVSFVHTTGKINACHASYLLSFFLFTILLTMMCLQYRRTHSVRPPIIVEAHPVTNDEKI